MKITPDDATELYNAADAVHQLLKTKYKDIPGVCIIIYPDSVCMKETVCMAGAGYAGAFNDI